MNAAKSINFETASSLGENITQFGTVTNEIYEPARTLGVRIKRRLTPFMARRQIQVKLDRPLVSFSFDDCPKSAIDNALPALEARSWCGTVYLACGLFNITNHLGLHMSAQDALAISKAGHEIGDHTFSHYDALNRPQDIYQADIARNQDAFEALGLPKAETFAYPYGQTYGALKTALGGTFKGLRGISPLTHSKHVDLNQIGSYPLFSGTDLTSLLGAIANLAHKPGWITIFTHDVRDNPSAWGCTQNDLERVIKAVADIDAQVLPVADAITLLEGKNA